MGSIIESKEITSVRKFTRRYAYYSVVNFPLGLSESGVFV